MIANERRPVYLWHGWFEHLPQKEIHQRLMLANVNKNWRDSLWFARKTTDCSPTLPFGRRSKFGKLWPNGICFQPPLPFPSKVTPCQVRNDQSVFLWVNLSSDLDPRSREFVTTTETQNQKNGYFLWQSENTVCVLRFNFEKVASLHSFFKSSHRVYMRKLYCKALRIIVSTLQ